MILLPSADYLHIKYKKLSDVLINEEKCVLSHLIGSVSIIPMAGLWRPLVKAPCFKASAALAAAVHSAAARVELRW